MIPNVASKLSTNLIQPLVNTVNQEICKVAYGALRTQVRSLNDGLKNDSCYKRPTTSCQQHDLCPPECPQTTGKCNPVKKYQKGGSTCGCGYKSSNVKDMEFEICGNCCPKACVIKDPCCPIPCTKVVCPDREPLCCNKRCCCPMDAFQKLECCKPPPPVYVKRCARPGACDDPCCPREPKCARQKKRVLDCDDDIEDEDIDAKCPRECPPDINSVSGTIGAGSYDDDCLEKTFQCETVMCPRKLKCQKKEKKPCPRCLELDPNWPPQRPQCYGFPAKDPCTPCQRPCRKKEVFNDGIC